MNLLDETVKILAQHKHTANDVVWVGSDIGWFSWEKFEELAKNTNYYAGYGGQEVAKDLVVVGRDFWLERHEYDGSEWWEFKELPKKPFTNVKPRCLTGGSWETLAEMNNWVAEED